MNEQKEWPQQFSKLQLTLNVVEAINFATKSKLS